MFIKKHLPILEKLYKHNEKIVQNIPIEETDISSIGRSRTAHSPC